jgi:hypothetical protein
MAVMVKVVAQADFIIPESPDEKRGVGPSDATNLEESGVPSNGSSGSPQI